MIQPEELRIGNWVYNPTIRTNMQVYPMMIPQLHRIVSEGGQPNIEPIPLTEEILLKCGFGRSDGCYYIKCHRKHITFSLPVITHWIKKPVHTEIGSPHSVKYPHIRFLHQLQNLFYSLTGKELEVKL